MQYYIHKCKSNNSEEITKYFNQFILNITDDKKYNLLAINPFKKYKNKQIFTSIDLLASLESLVITEVLNNKVFLHSITLKNETILPPAPIFFPFNTVTKSQYNNTKVKRLFIDFYMLTQFINRLDQLKALQMLNGIIMINNIIASLTNFTFAIHSIASLKYINLNLTIKLVIFHIMSVKMSFLLYLTNINKLNVFFNNLTNKLVCNKFIHLIISRYDYAFLIKYMFIYLFIAKLFNVNLYYLTKVQHYYLYCYFD